MSNSTSADELLANVSHEEIISALFANMVVQQTNMALIFLGKVPHPETGQRTQDIDTARIFIDQLEMLEVKTKGNLDQREEALLKQSLTAVRMAFVEIIDSGASQPDVPPDLGRGAAEEADQAPTAPVAEGQTEPSPDRATSAAEAESRKKFTKKY